MKTVRSNQPDITKGPAADWQYRASYLTGILLADGADRATLFALVEACCAFGGHTVKEARK